MNDWLRVRRGEAPLILAIPHAGTRIPPEIAGRLHPNHCLMDTDWHVDRLYGFAEALGATRIETRIARTVVDVNRDPSGASLYPGQATTELCPTTSFDGRPLYAPGDEPTDREIVERRSRWFVPYHAALEAEVARLRAAHPAIVVYDAHSIRSVVARLFEGVLPAFNIGTANSTSCAPALAQFVSARCVQTGQPTVVDGRFSGGWTTRHYGRPDRGVHAIQMELAQRLYLEEAEMTPAWKPLGADGLVPALTDILSACIEFAKAQP